MPFKMCADSFKDILQCYAESLLKIRSNVILVKRLRDVLKLSRVLSKILFKRLTRV